MSIFLLISFVGVLVFFSVGDEIGSFLESQCRKKLKEFRYEQFESEKLLNTPLTFFDKEGNEQHIDANPSLNNSGEPLPKEFEPARNSISNILGMEFNLKFEEKLKFEEWRCKVILNGTHLANIYRELHSNNGSCYTYKVRPTDYFRQFFAVLEYTFAYDFNEVKKVYAFDLFDRLRYFKAIGKPIKF